MPPLPLRGLLIRARRILEVGLVNLVLIVCVLFLAEGAARGIGFRSRGEARGDRLLWRYEALRGWGLTKGAVGEDYRGGPDRGLVRINVQGFRGPNLVRSPSRDTRRILVLGDSFGFGVGVDEPHLVSSRLAELVNADKELTGGARVDVLNLSVSGYSTDQELLTYEEQGALLDPDVVILLMCDNDFDGNLEDFMYGRYYKPRFEIEGGGVRLVGTPVPRAERRRPVRTWLFDHSALAAALIGRGDRAGLSLVSRWLAPGTSSRSRASSQDLMMALLRKLDQDVRRAGATLVTFNTGHRGEQTGLFQALRPSLERAGIAHTGLEGPMGRARQTHPEIAWDFPGDTHWNVAAHDLAARVIHLHLRRLAREGRLGLGAGDHPPERPGPGS